MKTEHPALSLLTDLIEDIKTESAPKNVTEETNIELLNVINSDVQNVKQFTKMPAISEELYNELVKEFDNQRMYFFNDSYNLED